MLFNSATAAAAVAALLSLSDGVSGSSATGSSVTAAAPEPATELPPMPSAGPDVNQSTLVSPGTNITLVAQILDGPSDEFIQTFGNQSSTQYLVGERSQTPWPFLQLTCGMLDDGNSGFSLSNDSTQATVFLQGLQTSSHLNWTRFGVGGQPCVLGLVVGDGRPAEPTFAWPQHYGSLTNIPQINLLNGGSPLYYFYGGSHTTAMIE